jgi:hypothetical protein
MTAPFRLVVCSVGGARGHLELPESRVGEERPFISGGERSLYELAVAGAALGLDVELRGSLNRSILAELTTAAGVAPRVGLEPRRPEANDIVVVPEAIEIEVLTAVHLSRARGVMYLLAPLGLCGWSFLDGWREGRDPRTVPLDSVGRPESYRAIDSLGFAVWTNAHGLAEAGRHAGVEVEWVGTGTPVPFPAVPAKTVDIAVVEANRWAGWAEELVARIPEASILRIGPTASTYSLCEAMGPASILVWPSRIEGMSRIAREARGVGTVPVALDTNPFATRQDHGDGVVLVSDPDAIVNETRRLLMDPGCLQVLQSEAVTGARVQADWSRFVERVGAVVARSADHLTSPAREQLGDELRRRDDSHRLEAEQRIEGLVAELTRIEADSAVIRRESDGALEQREAARRERDGALEQREAARRERDGALEQREAARRERDGALAELEAHRKRLTTRLIDRSRLGAGWRTVRSWSTRG